jgi:hypothetical protein
MRAAVVLKLWSVLPVTIPDQSTEPKLAGAGTLQWIKRVGDVPIVV